MTRAFTIAQDYSKDARPPIALTPVKSNQVKAVGYDAATQTLAVTFTRGAGAVYHYPNVTPEAHAEFVGAESIGKHFGQHIQSLPFSKFAPDPAPEREEA